MSNYVRERLEGGEQGNLEEEAVDAYFEIPINERIRMHNSELKQLRSRLDTADEKVANATDFFSIPSDRVVELGAQVTV
jgi:K+ transporter